MPALYSHTTRANGTVLTATIYNGDHQNHIDNGVPAQLDDYSVNAGQMQSQVSPGGVGSESLPTSLAGELERIRYVLARLQNKTFWYDGGIGPQGYMSVTGSAGINNPATPLTKYNIVARAFTARDASGGVLVKLAPASTVVDIGVAGPAAGGRDQAGAFSADSWIYLYWILKADGTYSAIASATAPGTGPALPSGYTHWAYAYALRLNASTQFHRTYCSGAHVFYDVANAGSNRILTAGTATSLTSVAADTVVSPDANRIQYNFIVEATYAGAGAATVNYRPAGSAAAAPGQIAVDFNVGADLRARGANSVDAPVINGNRAVEYMFSSAVSTGGVYIDILSYTVPNGDV